MNCQLIRGYFTLGFYKWNIGSVKVISLPNYYILLEGSWMRGEDARPPPKMAEQKFLATSHKPIKIQCFKSEKCL